jgi:hypothetical protein
MPAVVATEDRLEVGYILHPHDFDKDAIAVVRFERPYAHLFGPPNDEAFAGHPLAGRGLRPYGAFRIDQSSWIRRLEEMNRVHEHHRPETFAALTHYVLSFHDTTFECVAASYEVNIREVDGPLTLSVDVTP